MAKQTSKEKESVLKAQIKSAFYYSPYKRGCFFREYHFWAKKKSP